MDTVQLATKIMSISKENAISNPTLTSLQAQLHQKINFVSNGQEINAQNANMEHSTASKLAFAQFKTHFANNLTKISKNVRFANVDSTKPDQINVKELIENDKYIKLYTLFYFFLC